MTGVIEIKEPCPGKCCGTWVGNRHFPAMKKPDVEFCSDLCARDHARREADAKALKAHLESEEYRASADGRRL